jgi:hypothetical protein
VYRKNPEERKQELAPCEVGNYWVFAIRDPHGSEFGDHVEPNSKVHVGGITLGLEEAERKPAIAGHELVAAGKLFAR